jgi:hypothetical protein
MGREKNSWVSNGSRGNADTLSGDNITSRGEAASATEYKRNVNKREGKRKQMAWFIFSGENNYAQKSCAACYRGGAKEVLHLPGQVTGR